MRDNEAAVRQYLGALGPEAMMLDGLEDALVGVTFRFGQDPIALYDRRKCIEIFMSEGCTEEEAEEHFEFNVIGAWVGDGTPAFMLSCDQLEGRAVYDTAMEVLEELGQEPYVNTLKACEVKLALREGTQAKLDKVEKETE